MADSLEVVIGRHVASVRAEFKVSRDAFASRGRAHGARWSIGSVGHIEAGDSSLTVQNLVILSAVLTEISGRPHTLGEAFGETGAVSINNMTSVRSASLKSWLSGSPVDLSARQDDLPVQEVMRMVAAITEGEPRVDPSDPVAWKRRQEAHAALPKWTPTLTEQRAATKLGLQDHILFLWAWRLWGKSFADEIRARTSEGSSPQKRGHVTRVLLREIEDAYRATKPKVWQRQNPPLTHG